MRASIILSGIVLSLASGAEAQPLAFPGAEGFGRNAAGGRGGAVMQVTTLADSGAGSLRACVAATGPRTCVFRVGGTITLGSEMKLGGGYLTIAGQTAPGGGILLRAGPATQPGALLRINRSHVIVRHVRFRRGPSDTGSGDSNDALQLLNASDVILDHVSASWGVDEDLGLSTSRNVTVQWSVISEPLYRSNHPKGPHSMGALLYAGTGSYTFHHNLFAHSQERNPRINVGGTVDVVNNLVHNPGTTPTVITSDFGKVSVNYVGNTYRKGPNSPSTGYAVDVRPTSYGIGVYASGNAMPNGAGPVRQTQYLASARFDAPSVTTQSAAAAADLVLAKAGAWPRDAADVRVVGEVRSGAGRVIDSPSQVGGWPLIASGEPYLDADKDGMSDQWELARGLRTGDPGDRNGDLDGDGYTNLEEFLNELAESLGG